MSATVLVPRQADITDDETTRPPGTSTSKHRRHTLSSSARKAS
jgi:hypothetical protein